jgi:hypothetical protein
MADVAVGVDKKTQIIAVGTAMTNTPQTNVACLMYYLSCVNGCLKVKGETLVPAKFADYRNHAALTGQEELTVILLCGLLNPIELIDVCFFVVPSGHPALGGTRNEFLEISKATTIVAAAAVKGKIAVFKGSEVQTQKIMICDQVWLKTYFLDPFEKEAVKLKALEAKTYAPILNLDLTNFFSPVGKICREGKNCQHFERLNNPHCAEFKVCEPLI